ncbi:hypothetical protein HDU96_001561, partial [Phlyctochytrium bullatum]
MLIKRTKAVPSAEKDTSSESVTATITRQTRCTKPCCNKTVAKTAEPEEKIPIFVPVRTMLLRLAMLALWIA